MESRKGLVGEMLDGSFWGNGFDRTVEIWDDGASASWLAGFVIQLVAPRAVVFGQ